MRTSPAARTTLAVTLLVGAVVLAVLAARWLLPQLGLAERFTRPVAAAPRPHHILAQLENGSVLVMPHQAPAPAAAPPGPCEFEPLLAPASRKDGRYRLVDGAGTLPDADAYLEVASEAAAAGRRRDSEVALIMACRVSGSEGVPDRPEVREAQQRLASLYLEQARSQAQAGTAAPYLDRAQFLLD